MNQIAPISPDQTESLNAVLIRALADPAMDPARLQLMRELRREMQRDAYNEAMARAQAEMEPIVRDAINSHIGNRYARLAAIDRGIRPIYCKHGFSVRYGSGKPVGPGWLNIICFVSHSGHEEPIPLDSPLDNAGARGNANKTPIQALGSTITYLRRYLVCMAFNVVIADDPDDDDGEATRRGRGTRDRLADPPRHRTVAEWLNEFAMEMAGCDWPEDIDGILARPGMPPRSFFEGEALTQYDGIIQTTRERVAEQRNERDE